MGVVGRARREGDIGETFDADSASLHVDVGEFRWRIYPHRIIYGVRLVYTM